MGGSLLGYAGGLLGGVGRRNDRESLNYLYSSCFIVISTYIWYLVRFKVRGRSKSVFKVIFYGLTLKRRL